MRCALLVEPYLVVYNRRIRNRDSETITLAELFTMIYTFERKQIDQNRLYGLVVSESNSLILIQREYDFQFDGYMVIRRRDISKSYSSDSNSYSERLMRKEGLWKNPPKAIRSLPLDDWRALLISLTGKPVVIENERKGNFYIGPVVVCEDHSVVIHYFDGCGRWQKFERVQYRGITSVQFGNRYCTIHYRHLPPQTSNLNYPSSKTGVK
jgi:hypothetical protein